MQKKKSKGKLREQRGPEMTWQKAISFVCLDKCACLAIGHSTVASTVCLEKLLHHRHFVVGAPRTCFVFKNSDVFHPSLAL